MRVVLLLLLVAFALAQEPSTSGPLNDVSSNARSRQFWTAKKMREAISLDIEIEGEPNFSEFSEEQADELARQAPPVYVEGKDSIVFPNIIDDDETENENAKRLLGAHPPASSYTTYPWRTVGKVFFTAPNGLNYVCSGSVVRQHVIATAGHCVYSGGWVSNWAFVPGYNNGVAPYGVFSAYQLFSNTAWTNSGIFCYDWAFVVVNRVSAGGLGVGDVVGTLGYSFNAINSPWRSLGYPQAAPFNGQENYYVDSGLINRDAPGGCAPGTLHITSDATGGSSGGPWIYNFGGLNYLNSVNSYKYNNDPNSMYGPYFDTNWGNSLATAVGVSPP